jgi:hypothetical protein
MRSTLRRSSASRDVLGGTLFAGVRHGAEPSERAFSNTRVNFDGGLPRSPESSPTPVISDRNGMAASRVLNASSSDRWRRKQRMSSEVMP